MCHFYLCLVFFIKLFDFQIRNCQLFNFHLRSLSRKYIGNNTIYHKYIELFNAVAVTNMSIFVVHDHVDGKFDLDRKGVPGSTVKK